MKKKKKVGIFAKYYYGDHVKDCVPLKNFRDGSWPSPWGPHEGTVFGSVNNPKRKGHYMWEVYMCNSIRCHAKIAIRLNLGL